VLWGVDNWGHIRYFYDPLQQGVQQPTMVVKMLLYHTMIENSSNLVDQPGFQIMAELRPAINVCITHYIFLKV